MSQSAADANAITKQPLISPMEIADMENMANSSAPPDEAASVITTQPMINDPTDEEQEEKKQQKTETVRETLEAAEEVNAWCWFADCSRNCECPSYDNCCVDCGDCCTGCCDDGPSADVNDCFDCAGCLEGCGTCSDCCSSD